MSLKNTEVHKRMRDKTHEAINWYDQLPRPDDNVTYDNLRALRDAVEWLNNRVIELENRLAKVEAPDATQ